MSHFGPNFAQTRKTGRTTRGCGLYMTRFEKKVWLSSPTMHGDEIKYVTEAYETNWMSTVGANINELEKLVAEAA